MNTVKTIQSYKVKDAFATTFLAAIMSSAWGRFNDATRHGADISAISGTASFPVGYLFAGADAESIKLTVDVELSGSQFPFEGGTHRQPNFELAEDAFNLFKQNGQVLEATNEQPAVFEMAEILATGKGRYSVKVKFTVRLTTTISTATSTTNR